MKTKIDTKYIQNEFKKTQNYYLAGHFKKVIEKTKILIKKDPRQIPFYNYQALSYRQLGDLQTAEKILSNASNIFPKSTSVINNLASIYRLLKKYNEADALFIKALAIKPNDYVTLCNYANLKRDLNKDEDALKLFQNAYKIKNDNEVILNNLVISYQVLGKFKEAKLILKEILEKFPNNTKADYQYSSIHKYEEIDIHQISMIKKIETSNQTKENKVYLNFALAKSYSDQKNYEKAAEYFIKGNFLQSKILNNYDFEENETKVFEIIKNHFSQFDLKKYLVSHEKKPDLIFITGLPRSGTTLSHQILSNHSDVYGAGELNILNKFFLKNIQKKDFFENLITQTENIRNDLYPQFTNLDDKKIILDKAPLNFRWIGYIKILFPNAKIIHCKRNIKDTALSIFKNYFDGGSIAWSYNEKNLLKFINLYENLMSFWEKKVPNHVYNLNYEALTENKEFEIKKLIKFCNLNWEDSCLDHTNNKTAIKTVSVSQAREAIYKSSVDLSLSYEKYLNFLKNL